MTSRIALATATPTAMIAPMNDWRFSVVPVSEQRQRDAGQHRRDGGDGDERQPDRLEVRRQQQEDDDDRDEPGRRPGRGTVRCSGVTWPRTST